ncbi:drug resistance transporter EmrB/QacA subfamily [Renibacterium salmoninarum ATCC 33209]|uniref:Drug resistance transporter EmrB/QacA subfamily n=1 Tax=Renibacterium salmoninarum (strain ATCC 33209 / DSM 20767 / JCM 11484 / NBRC 15589 / NCIMB 2235) TaxID=288705 RepID=A9WLJ4_RENSM|nr:MDR family MFS transporter [Renibacterium salmoninarum]ABY21954.1 drug resistance transporter EmrB/QacA subfamily [Renibacterium salmoninarum ATCC 33209]
MASHSAQTSLPVADTAPMSHRQIMEALTGLLAAFFTAILSSTIVANALPTIMSDLKGTQTDFAWVVTAALLANAATTPIWGKLSDLFNKKLLVQLSIVIFVTGSVVAGLSQSIPMLLTARVIQGVALGGLTALAQAIIGTMIAPRERGRYSGYMGAVMAVGTAGGPLLGGVIVDSPLGWRWTFYICVPLAVIALVLLQKTLKIVHVRKAAKIDWAGSILLTAGVSLILIWISFAGKAGYYDWISWQSALMAGGGLLLLVVMLFVESKVSEPIIPLKIISQRTTALAILASVAVGVALFGSSTFLGQYFQISRGATPTEAGLLMLPLIAGNLIGSVLSGQLISRFGKWTRFLVAGAILLIGGLGFAGRIDHTTNLTLVGLFIFIMGLGLGLMLQNLVFAVQNTVRVEDIGSASSSVAFFRSFGGAIGVSVLGAVLANRVTSLSSDGLTKLGVPSSAQQSGGSLDLADMPAPIRDVIWAAYGDATSLIFTISAIIAVVALIAVLFIKERALRTTVELKEPVADAPLVQQSEPELDLDQEFAEVLSATGSIPKVGPTRFAEATQPGKRVLLIEEPVAQKLADTQQQLQLSTAMSEVHRISAEQQALQSQQAQTARGLIELERQLAAERRIQQAAAHYLASRAGREDGQLG